METQTFKILAAIILWLVIFGFGLIPIKWKQMRSNSKLIALSNCFSGGLFIAIGLIHILPEAHSLLEGKQESQPNGQTKSVFPLSYTICLLTFSFLLFIDKVLFNNADMEADNNKSNSGFKKPESGVKFAHKDKSSNIHFSKFKEDNFKSQEQIQNEKEDEFKRRVNAMYKLALNFKKTKSSKKVCCEKEHSVFNLKVIKAESDSDISGSCIDESSDNLKAQNEEEENLLRGIKENLDDTKRKTEINKVQSPKKTGKDGHHHHFDFIVEEKSKLKAYMILVAMGLHGVFSGLALGVSNNRTDLFYLFLAMLFHKWSEALTVGISFVRAGIPETKAVWMIFVFSIFTPFGILLGCLVPATDETMIGVCFALSAGTFLYISSAEIIVEEFSIAANKFPKFLFYLIGIAMVLAMGWMET